jgi:hypothetical protein
VRTTLRRFPQLQRFYDDAFLVKLCNRATEKNYLLWLLSQLEGDQYPDRFWRAVTADLDLLASEGAWRRFSGPLRRTTYEDIQQARTELDLAARLRRTGARIEFDPGLENGRCSEFCASTIPQTWWEVKQVLDEEKVRHTRAVIDELQRQLRSIREPYAIHIEAEDVEADLNVHALAKEAKTFIRTFHKSGGSRILMIAGIRFEIGPKSTHEHGYVGTMQQGYLFDDTQEGRVRASISSAIDQLPEQGGGVVVIDATASDWLNVETIEDACCGTESIAYTTTDHWMQRASNGIFHPNRCSRISAVGYYNGRETNSKRYPPLVLFHNPFAKVKIDANALAALNGVQFCYVRTGRGSMKRETLS